MKYTWWIFQLIMMLAALFFLVFGVDLLIGSYRLGEPFGFIMTFFAASFIILISLTIGVAIIVKMVRVYRHIKTPQPPEH